MLKYGTDKPDLRNPIEIFDVTEVMNREDVKLDIFKKLIAKGAIVRAIPAPNTSSKPRSFFDEYNNWAKEEGAKGLGYIALERAKEKLLRISSHHRRRPCPLHKSRPRWTNRQ